MFYTVLSLVGYTIKIGKEEYGMDNVHTAEMYVHYNDLVTHAKSEKRKKSMSSFSKVDFLCRVSCVLLDALAEPWHPWFMILPLLCL